MGIVKISDRMHDNIRIAGGALNRSINAQAEHWMLLGMLSELHPELTQAEIVRLLMRDQLAREPGGALSIRELADAARPAESEAKAAAKTRHKSGEKSGIKAASNARRNTGKEYA